MRANQEAFGFRRNRGPEWTRVGPEFQLKLWSIFQKHKLLIIRLVLFKIYNITYILYYYSNKWTNGPEFIGKQLRI